MRTRIAGLLQRLRSSETGKAAGLAVAMIVNNVLALIASIVFARLLSDYGALAALVSYVIILTVVGQALQVATAREGVLGHLGDGEELLATLERWGISLAIFSVAATILSVLLRQQIADLVGVRTHPWAAALGLPGGCMYVALSILRGALQGLGDYNNVGYSLIGEQAVRLIAGAVLAAVGLDVGGAYLGSLIAYALVSVWCMRELYKVLAREGYRRWWINPGARRRGALSLWQHTWAAGVPIAALAIIALLQNIDLITAKHQFSDRVASSYAAAAVAGKVLIWVAMGASFYLVPETSRRRAEGRDTRTVLLQSLGIIGVCAIPCLLIYAVAAHPLLAIVFGTRRAIASSCLLPLGAAFCVLAATYLAVQYMLALRRTWFLIAIGIVAAVEPVLLLQAPRQPEAFATVVLAVQAAGALLAYGLAFGLGARRASEEAELLRT